MQQKQIESVSGLLKSISHPIRLQILCLLQEGEMSVADLLEKIHTTNANISQHLSVLRNQGVIGARKDANFIYNRIIDPRVSELINSMDRLFCSSGSR